MTAAKAFWLTVVVVLALLGVAGFAAGVTLAIGGLVTASAGYVLLGMVAAFIVLWLCILGGSEAYARATQ